METTNTSLHLRKDLNQMQVEEEEKKVARRDPPNDYSEQYDQSILSSPDGPLN